MRSSIKILPEPTTRVAGLETGEIDYIVKDVPSDQYATGRRASTTSTSRSRPRTTASGSPSTRSVPPFDNVKVRQALNYAVDKAGLRALYWPDSAGDEGDARLSDALWTVRAAAVAGRLG